MAWASSNRIGLSEKQPHLHLFLFNVTSVSCEFSTQHFKQVRPAIIAGLLSPLSDPFSPPSPPRVPASPPCPISGSRDECDCDDQLRKVSRASRAFPFVPRERVSLFCDDEYGAAERYPEGMRSLLYQKGAVRRQPTLFTMCGSKLAMHISQDAREIGPQGSSSNHRSSHQTTPGAQQEQS
jgi:hypothetical protein